MRCPMCSTTFAPRDEAGGCASCPLHRWGGGCSLELVACPSCGYHALPSELSPAAPAASSVAGQPETERSSQVGAGVPLREVRTGSRARVAGITGDAGIARRLIAYGVAPGAEIELMQRTPAFIVRVDATELALAPEIAAEIRVVAGG